MRSSSKQWFWKVALLVSTAGFAVHARAGEPSWFNGGAKPSLYPWLAGQLGLRYQPDPKFVARLDLGLGTSGLFFGVGADYGL